MDSFYSSSKPNLPKEKKKRLPIGQLNGKWAFIFKINNVASLLLIPWISWISLELIQLKVDMAKMQTNHFTSVEGDAVKIDIAGLKATVNDMTKLVDKVVNIHMNPKGSG